MIMRVPIAQMSHKSFCSNFNGAYSGILPIPPDLAPSDFALFPALKVALGGKKFSNDEEFKTFTQNYFAKFGHTVPLIEHTKFSLEVR